MAKLNNSRGRRRTKQRIHSKRLKRKPSKKPGNTLLRAQIVVGTVINIHNNNEHSNISHHEHRNQPRSPLLLRGVLIIRTWVIPRWVVIGFSPSSFQISATHFTQSLFFSQSITLYEAQMSDQFRPNGLVEWKKWRRKRGVSEIEAMKWIGIWDFVVVVVN